MSEVSSGSILSRNVYDEKLNEEFILDLSHKDLESIPQINGNAVCVLYLQNNSISTLSDDFFPSLPNLMYLDLRDNKLTLIPKTIQEHRCLTHLLLQNNCLTALPNELGTVVYLKIVQLSGNPLTYPPAEIISGGTSKILTFLNDKFMDDAFGQSQSELSEDNASTSEEFPGTVFSPIIRSYNSVIDQAQLEKRKTLSVKFNEKEDSQITKGYSKKYNKCPRLPESRSSFASKQSAKYLRPLRAPSKNEQEARMKRSYLLEMATKKHMDLVRTRDKILQEQKNSELLQQWKRNYRNSKQYLASGDHKIHKPSFPYDTSPEYMTLLSREDIEKDLPDKYRKKLVRRVKPTIPRTQSNDVHLAMRIKHLFENLESIDLNGGSMTPRTEQKVLLHEIKKISEIKQKLTELSEANGRSVQPD